MFSSSKIIENLPPSYEETIHLESKDAKLDAQNFFRQIQNRKEWEGLILDKKETYHFSLGSAHTVSGCRLDIESNGKTIDYIGLGVDPIYVKEYCDQLFECFKKNGYKV